jgi:hypothetical protein
MARRWQMVACSRGYSEWYGVVWIMSGIQEDTRESQIHQGGDIPRDLACEPCSPHQECPTVPGHPHRDGQLCHGLWFDVLFCRNDSESQPVLPNCSSATGHAEQLVTHRLRWLMARLNPIR